MIGHQMLLGLLNENFQIHAHFKSKKPKQDFLKTKSTISYYFEITALNIESFLSKVNPDIIINAAGVTIRRANETSIDQIIFINSLLPNILNNWSEKNKSDKVFEKSIEIIKENPIKHLYLSLMFYIRGVFLETQNDEYPAYLQVISSMVHWSSILLLPIIFFYSLITFDKRALLILPSMFVIVSYSLFTDFEPRYGSVVSSTYILILMMYINSMLRNLRNEK